MARAEVLPKVTTVNVSTQISNPLSTEETGGFQVLGEGWWGRRPRVGEMRCAQGKGYGILTEYLGNHPSFMNFPAK